MSIFENHRIKETIGEFFTSSIRFCLLYLALNWLYNLEIATEYKYAIKWPLAILSVVIIEVSIIAFKWKKNLIRSNVINVLKSKPFLINGFFYCLMFLFINWLYNLEIASEYKYAIKWPLMILSFVVFEILILSSKWKIHNLKSDDKFVITDESEMKKEHN